MRLNGRLSSAERFLDLELPAGPCPGCQPRDPVRFYIPGCRPPADSSLRCEQCGRRLDEQVVIWLPVSPRMYPIHE
jgi:hypothetical protein